LPNEKLELYKKRMTEVPGAFDFPNLGVFDVLNDLQVDKNVKGDILEIGCFTWAGARSSLASCWETGNSSSTPASRSRFQTPTDPDFLAHTVDWYEPYTQEVFEQNYVQFHSELPEIYAHSSLELPGGPLRQEPSNSHKP